MWPRWFPRPQCQPGVSGAAQQAERCVREMPGPADGRPSSCPGLSWPISGDWAGAQPTAPSRRAPSHRAEPALERIQEDRRRVVLPAIDNIRFDTFEVQQYASAAHGYSWGLWCMYIAPPQDWLDRGDEAAPIR